MPEGYTSAAAVHESTAKSTDELLVTGTTTLYGFSCLESTGSATATFVIRDGTDATGKPVVYVTLQANESDRDWFADMGLPIGTGIFIDRLSGSCEVVCYAG